MLFNSIAFVIFFPVVTLLYYLLPHRFRWMQLLLAGGVFYAFFIPAYLLILIGLIIIDYCMALAMVRQPNHRKTWLWVSICSNIGLLAFFKYYNFFIGNINSVTGSNWALLHIVLPIGLSFHTFQSIAYTVEVYRGKQQPMRHLGYYALYVLFYPQLVAGPIERPTHLLPQLQTPQPLVWQNILSGLRLLLWGFVKKMVIADRLAAFVEGVFQHSSEVGAVNTWLGIVFFTIQIYTDFSGYCDIALGSARCMGIELTNNFNRPYQALNIQDFWRRWHISLSTWFRDYVYIPLGGNRRGPWKQAVFLLLTFALSGLWHGAGWTFVAWGCLHGLYLIAFQLWGKTNFHLPKMVSWLLTLLLVMLAWVFFRAANLQEAWTVLCSAFNIQDIWGNGLLQVPVTGVAYSRTILAFIIVSVLYVFWVERKTSPDLQSFNSKVVWDGFFIHANLLLLLFFGIYRQATFIYFQF